MKFPGARPRWGFIHILLIPLVVMGLQALYFNFGNDFFSYWAYMAGLPLTRVSDFILNYLLYFLLFMGTVLLVLITTRSRPEKVGFKKQEFKKTLRWGMGGGLVLFVLIMLSGYIIQLLAPELPPQPFEDVLRGVSTFPDLIAMLLVGSVLAPLVEEIYFRGMVYPVLRKHIGVPLAIVVSGIIFGTLHWDLWRMVPLALGGMALAYIYERSRTIYAPWMAHGVWNGIMALIVFWG